MEDKTSNTIEDIREKVRRMSAEGADYVIIDYLQLISSRKKHGNKNEEMGYIAQTLKNIAKDFDMVVIALSQLSRAVEQRGGDKRPMLSDLRDSGAIEQAANVIIFLYRPGYYGFETDENGNAVPAGLTLWIVAKQRDGPTGVISLVLDTQSMRLEEYIASEYYDMIRRDSTQSIESGIPEEMLADPEDLPF